MLRAILVLLSLAFAGGSAMAAEASAGIVLTLPQDAQLRTVEYLCPPGANSAADPIVLSVRYIDAHPDFLAILPVEDESQIFVRLSGGEGVIYASGDYLWQTDGVDAALVSVAAGPDAEPLLTCYEAGDIP
jgi:membrane-bound inhibitor of C-type lysozyme